MENKSLDEVLVELNQAEKEFDEKCLKYGIEEIKKKKKETENPSKVGNENIKESSEN